MTSTTVCHGNDNDDKRDTIMMLRPITHTASDSDSYQWNSTAFENLEDLRIIWLDENILKTDDCRDTIEKLSHIITYLQIFTDTEICIDYIKRTQGDKIFFIVSNRLKNSIKYVHDFLTAAYIFCMKEFDQSRDWTMKELTKVRGIFTNQQELISKLSKDVLIIVKQIPMTVFEINKFNEQSTTTLHEQQSSYIWWHILMGTLVGDQPLDTANAKLQLVEECELYYKNNKRELQKIKEFDETYSSTDAIKWYTYDSFLYRLINKALRTQDIDIVFKFRFFLNDLYRQLFKAHLNSLEHLPEKIYVYRGQRMQLDEINTLKRNLRQHVSMNTFLSTTANRNIAKAFAGESDALTESVLFEITIDTKLIKIPFAMVEDSAEEEVLISIGAVFQIVSVKSDLITHLWHIKLDLIEDIDEKVRDLIEHYRPYGCYNLTDSRDKSKINMIKNFEEKRDEDQQYLLRLGFCLWRMGQIDKAEQYWKMVLNSKDFNIFHYSLKCELYTYLGLLYRETNNTKALEYYELAARILLELPRHDIPWLAFGSILREMGHIYTNRNQFDTALKKLELARRFIRSSLGYDKMVLYCTIDTSIGKVYYQQELYEQALKKFNEAYELQVTNLPEYHPETALTLGYIGKVNYELKKFTASVGAFKKALHIKSICYPSNHESTLITHMDIATVHYKSGDLSASVQHFEIALIIAKSIYTFNNNELIRCYKLLARVYSETLYHWLYKKRDYDIAKLYQKLIIELVEQCPLLENDLNLEKIDQDLRLFPSQLNLVNEGQETTTTFIDHKAIPTTAVVDNEIKIATSPTLLSQITNEELSPTTHNDLPVDVLQYLIKLTEAIRNRSPLYTLRYYSGEEMIKTVLQYVAFMNGYEYQISEISHIKHCFSRPLLTSRYVGLSNEWTNFKYTAVATCLSSLQQQNEWPSYKYAVDQFIETFQELMIKYLIDGGIFSDLSGIDHIRQFFEMAIESQNPLFILEAYTLESEFYHRISDDFNRLHPTVVNYSIGRHIAALFKYHTFFTSRTYNGKTYRWMKMMYPKPDELLNFRFIDMRFMVKSLLSTTKLINKDSPIVAVLNEKDNGIYDSNSYELVLCEFILTKKSEQTSAIDVDTLSLYPDEGEVLILPYTVFMITFDGTMLNENCSFIRLEEQISPKYCECSRCQSDIDRDRMIVLTDMEDVPEAEVDAVLQRYKEKNKIIDSITVEDIINP